MELHSVVSGTKFKEIYEGEVFIKLTNKDERHRYITFKDGLNVDPVPFNPKGDCSAGGIYFIKKEEIGKWITYAEAPMFYYRYVDFPSDALIYSEGDKFKADKLLLGGRHEIFADDDELFKLILVNFPQCLEYTKIQTEEFCLIAVSSDGLAIRYVNQQTDNVCRAAIKQNSISLLYIKEKTDELEELAIKESKNGECLRYVRKQTDKLCMQAVKQNGIALKFIKVRTPILCLTAAKNNGRALQYVPADILTIDICENALKQAGFMINHVPFEMRTEALWKIAVRQNGMNLEYSCRLDFEQSEELCMIAVKHCGKALKFVCKQTVKICEIALANNALALKYVKIDLPVELREKAIKL